jgi:hypothetical protein
MDLFFLVFDLFLEQRRQHDRYRTAFFEAAQYLQVAGQRAPGHG